MAAPGPSERGLEVGVQDGFSIWRLDVIGSFLKFQQHGHLKRGEQMDPWDSGRTRDLAAGLCAPQSPGRGGGERLGPCDLGDLHCGAGMRSGPATQVPRCHVGMPHRTGHLCLRGALCSGGQKAGDRPATTGGQAPWEHG